MRPSVIIATAVLTLVTAVLIVQHLRHPEDSADTGVMALRVAARQSASRPLSNGGSVRSSSDASVNRPGTTDGYGEPRPPTELRPRHDAGAQATGRADTIPADVSEPGSTAARPDRPPSRSGTTARRTAGDARSEAMQVNARPPAAVNTQRANPSLAPPAAPPEEAGQVKIANSAEAPTTETQPAEPSVLYDSGDEPRFSTQQQLQIPGAGPTGSASVWLQPEWLPDSQDDASIIILGDHQLHIFKNVSYIRFEYIDPTNPEAENGVGIPISDWQSSDWHQLTASWTPEGVAFYADGQMIGEPFPVRLNVRPGTPVAIGSNMLPGASIAPGALSNIQVRNQALGPAEVANQFASSPLTHKLPE